MALTRSSRATRSRTAARPPGREDTLFTLPPELRNEVYAYLFIASQEPITPRWAREDKPAYVSTNKALTQVSRAIRQETLPLYHSTKHYNIYYTDNGRDLLSSAHRWLKTLDSLAVKSLRTLTFGPSPIDFSVCCTVHFRINLNRHSDLWTDLIESKRVCYFDDKDSEDHPLHPRTPDPSEVNELVQEFFILDGKVHVTVKEIERFVKYLARIYEPHSNTLARGDENSAEEDYVESSSEAGDNSWR